MAFSGVTKLINQLTATTSIADTDNLIVGNTDAKRVTWAQIISLIKEKLNIGNTSLSGIGDGTITGAIKQNADDIDGLNGKSEMRLTHEYFTTDILVHKKGNTVTMSYFSDVNGNIPTGDMGNLFTLLEEYRPPYVVVAFTGPKTSIQVRVGTDGKVNFYNYGDAITQQTTARFTLTYVVD